MKPTEVVPSIESALTIVEALPEEQQILDYAGNNPRMLSQKAATTLCLCFEAMNKLFREETETEEKPTYSAWFRNQDNIFYYGGYIGGEGAVGSIPRLCLYNSEQVEEVATNPYYFELYRQLHG